MVMPKSLGRHSNPNRSSTFAHAELNHIVYALWLHLYRREGLLINNIKEKLMDRDEMLETIKFILDSYDDDYLQVIYDSVTATLQ